MTNRRSFIGAVTACVAAFLGPRQSSEVPLRGAASNFADHEDVWDTADELMLAGRKGGKELLMLNALRSWADRNPGKPQRILLVGKDRQRLGHYELTWKPE